MIYILLNGKSAMFVGCGYKDGSYLETTILGTMATLVMMMMMMMMMMMITLYLDRVHNYSKCVPYSPLWPYIKLRLKD